MALAESLDLMDMDDTGMWIWAGVLAVLGLGASWLIAIWWQRRKEKQKLVEAREA